VTSQPRLFFAIDYGSATTSAALVGYVGGRWRLIAHRSAPSSADVDDTLAQLLTQVHATDPALLAQIAADEGLDEAADRRALATAWPRLVSRTTPPRRIAVIAGSRRQRRRLEECALRAGWLVVAGSADEDDAVALSRLVLSPDTHAVLFGADRSPAGDEKRHLPDLAALLGAAMRLRPELAVVLAGSAAAYETTFLSNQEPVPAPDPTPVTSTVQDKGPVQTKIQTLAVPRDEAADGDEGDVETSGATTDAPASAPAPAPASTILHSSENPNAAHVLLAPDGEAGEPAGSALQQILEGLRAIENDGRLGIARSIASLAYVLDRSIEVVEVGLQGGLRARSEPVGQGHFAVASSHICLAGASIAPAHPSEDVVDGVMAWSTSTQDRHRVMDRLNDLRLVPWGEADGEGAVFRLAAAKAAVGLLIESTPELASLPMPALIVAAGGVFSSLPPAVVALAMADMIRRPGVCHLAVDEARLLGPLGSIEDEAERRRLLANLADDILVPLGSLILPAGLKGGRSAGQLRVKGGASTSEIELHPGVVQVVDLPPGQSSKVDMTFRDAVRLDSRGHHFSVDVAGGLVGLLVDMRDIPMRVSDRPESRRAALEAWQRGMWPEVDE
jgi:hypothetical protein